MASIALGAMERWLLLEQTADAGHYTNWLVVLDRPLRPELVAEALGSLRSRFPVHFCTLGVSDDGAGIEALLDKTRPVEDFVEVHSGGAGDPGALLWQLLNSPLDPVADGFFRCHVAGGSTPMLAVQSSHVAGDGFTNGAMRAALFEAYGQLAAGRRPPESEPPDLTGYGLSMRDIQGEIPTGPPIADDDRARDHRYREPVMSTEAVDDDATRLLTFRARLDRPAFRQLFGRAASFEVGTLAYLGACLAVAADRHFDPSAEREGDFIAVSFPRDLRDRPRWANRLGNIVFPFGVPLQRIDLESLERAAVRIQRTTRIAMTNWVYYRVFSHRLRAARKSPLPGDWTPRAALGSAEGRSSLQPLPSFGVTELPQRRVPASVGPAKIVDSFFQSPILGRRHVDGSAMISGSVRWNPAFDRRIRSFLGCFVNCLATGHPEREGDVAWELVGR